MQQSIEEVAFLTEESAAASEEAVQSVSQIALVGQTLKDLSTDLTEKVNRFKLL